MGNFTIFLKFIKEKLWQEEIVLLSVKSYQIQFITQQLSQNLSTKLCMMAKEAHFFISPKDDLSCVWMTNRTDLGGSGSYISAKIEELVFSEFGG